MLGSCTSLFQLKEPTMQNDLQAVHKSHQRSNGQPQDGVRPDDLTRPVLSKIRPLRVARAVGRGVVDGDPRLSS